MMPIAVVSIAIMVAAIIMPAEPVIAAIMIAAPANLGHGVAGSILVRGRRHGWIYE